MLTVTVAPAKISLLEVVAIMAVEYDNTSLLEACKLHPSSPAASPRRTAAVVMKVTSEIMCETCNGKGMASL
ncbi:hypothetical protein OIU74_027988 [Salix koriyanagi]|uniref:Uncharacterized protein n=1 Tax=Salix koriyanagi TaxID=2511006 RepID=A0A9Q0VAL8_9ROSI|nr:hypothetical protein OIU74_027988 [Salix koriyanagi]